MHHTLHIFQIIHRRAQHRLPPVTVTQCKPGKVKRRLLHCLQTMQLKIRTKVRKPNFGSKSVPELEPELGGPDFGRQTMWPKECAPEKASGNGRFGNKRRAPKDCKSSVSKSKPSSLKPLISER